MSIDTTVDPSIERFLTGLLAPVDDERDDADLDVVGELPDGLAGMFVRNGPNPQFTPAGAYHPFDGDGMVHAVYLGDGKARYRNRWVESRGLLGERSIGRACYGGLANFETRPDDATAEEYGTFKNNANTHFVHHADRYLALMEQGRPTEMSRELDTIGEFTFDGELRGPMTAHPKIDPLSAELIFFAYAPFPPYLRYHVANASGSLVHSTEIEIPAPVMMHDFAITENYTLFLDAPATFNIEGIGRGELPMRWAPDNGTRIGVLPRHGTNADVRWFEVENCYCVHFFNAFERGDKIELYGPAMSQMPGAFNWEKPDTISDPTPTKWTLDLSTGAARAETLDDRTGEFPRINDDLAGRPTRYLYNGRARSWQFDFDFNGVIKYDLETGSSSEWFHGNGTSGEHVFAPDPAGTAEDDGWLLSFVTDRSTEQSELVVLDARDIEEGPVARIQMKRRVPLGFHANWISEG